MEWSRYRYHFETCQQEWAMSGQLSRTGEAGEYVASAARYGKKFA